MLTSQTLHPLLRLELKELGKSVVHRKLLPSSACPSKLVLLAKEPGKGEPSTMEEF